MTYFYNVTIHCESEVNSPLSLLLLEFDCLGSEENQTGFLAYFSSEDIDKVELEALLYKLQTFHDFEFIIEKAEPKNWNAIWESDYKPIFVEDFCAIYAPFHEQSDAFKHKLIINPKMAFGTGHHETTQLMINQIKSLNFIEKDVLDLGSGTGILAILAKKEGAIKVDAIDIDENAFEIMKENFVENETKSISAMLGTIENINEKFDVILANINRNVLLNDSKEIVDRLNENGTLILSGFYEIDETMIIETYLKQGVHLKNKLTTNNWSSLLFVK